MAWNCLNVTSLPPAARNAALQSNCVSNGVTSPECASVTTWNATDPTGCSYTDSSGQYKTGVCDPNGCVFCYLRGGVVRGGCQFCPLASGDPPPPADKPHTLL